MKRWLPLIVLVLVAAGGALALARRSEPQAPVGQDASAAIVVRSLAKDGRILISFTLTAGFTDELREAIRSGLPATITYEVELRRNGLLWFDRTIASAVVTSSARFDNLTRQHQLSRTIDGRGEEPRLTEDEEVVRAWLTDFRLLPLFTTSQLEANAEYYVQVRARTRPRVNWFPFWPWRQDAASGYHRFTFVQ